MIMSRLSKGQQRVRPAKIRAYTGMTKGSISQMKPTKASLYTHYIDLDPTSPTYLQRVPIVS